MNSHSTIRDRQGDIKKAIFQNYSLKGGRLRTRQQSSECWGTFCKEIWKVINLQQWNRRLFVTVVTSVQSNKWIVQFQYFNSYSKNMQAVLAGNQQFCATGKSYIENKMGISLDHWTSASHHLKPPESTVQADGLCERLGAKLDSYWIHKQLKKPWSSVIYSAASFAESACTAWWQLMAERNSST